MSDDLLTIMCPPLSQYPKPPADHSESTLTKCPHCKKKMWLSAKKKILIKEFEKMQKDILLICYPCLMIKAKEMKESGEIDFMTDFVEVKI